MKVNAVVMYEFGAPEVLKWEKVGVPEPKSGEVLLRQTAIGLNFNETQLRAGKGSFPSKEFPIILGREAAGIVEKVGDGVTRFTPGQRVAYGMGGFGGYAEARLISEDALVALPENVPDQIAAAMMVKGMTAHYLLYRSYSVSAGENILIHAVAGGVGTILCQWAKHLGATVIGTVSSEAKANAARENGCDYPILYRQEDFAEKVREITKGQGVSVVYDSIGKDTFAGSIDSLGLRGHLVAYGNASGPVKCVEPSVLMNKGSLHYTKTALRHHISNRQELQTAAAELFKVVGAGAIKISLNQIYPLKEIAQAHRDLEARANTGSSILLP
ncbi:quinone oxidoreductase [Pseudomonadota bacterium]